MEPEHADQHERPFFFSCPHCKEPIRFSVEAAPEEDDDFEDDDDILDDELDSLYYATMDEMTTAIRDGDYGKAIPLIHENFKHLLELPKELGEREELPPGIPVLDRGTRVLAATGGKDALIPNPPKDTDGRREDRRRGMRELQGRWPGLDWGRWEVGGGTSVTAQAPNGRLRELGCAGDGKRIGSRELPRSWLVRVGGDVGSVAEGAVRLGVEWLAAGPGRD